MKNGGYKLKELGNDITLLYGFAEECCMYALKGRDKVLLVDTGMGTGDLKKAQHPRSRGPLRGQQPVQADLPAPGILCRCGQG